MFVASAIKYNKKGLEHTAICAASAIKYNKKGSAEHGTGVEQVWNTWFLWYTRIWNRRGTGAEQVLLLCFVEENWHVLGLNYITIKEQDVPPGDPLLEF